MIKRIDYDAFGNIIADINPSFEIPLGFAGGLYDPDTGLVRFGYRDYDPDSGRWTAKDPTLFYDNNINLFEYCLNNPINFSDPEGLFTWPYTWKGWVGVISTGAGASAMFAPIPGARPLGLGLLVAGACFTIWDTVEGFNQAEGLAKETAKNLIKKRISQAGGNAKLLQELGLLPSTEKLKELGFTDEELVQFGLIETVFPCE